MPTTAATDRVSRRQVDKFAERRAHLAGAALQTLSELGYARTSLREIAQNTDFSHGVLHYYFRDKIDLIIECVRQYKTVCVTRYDELVAGAGSSAELVAGFGSAMAVTLREDAAMHRLWYDMRSQSLFDETFRADVLELDQGLERMIWRVVTRLGELRQAAPSMRSAMAYALFDGLFQQALLHHVSGDASAAERLSQDASRLLDDVVPDLPVPLSSHAG